ncbi:phage tail protein [Paraneptunicella aestuarii]|uniref:phage tail protein n=1 Tax=Paraneptunicella aestuarii TaxID=2831148 RepID=UPI001E5D04D9|nr:phage tail protein [Paraneptunicella aestuarii]UAA38217.1 phage tail protein [Paraneptunicella aestuarii]
MTQQFYTVLTHTGAAVLANASALGQGIKLTEFAVGNGGGTSFNPDLETLKNLSALTNEVYRGAINELKVDPENPARYYAEGIVPVSVGGWTVREAGWFLDDGTLFAVTKYPPSYKSIPADGVATELPVRTYIATGSSNNVELKIDPTVVLATREYADSKIRWEEITVDTNAKDGQRYKFMGASILTLPAAGGDPVYFEAALNSGVSEETPAKIVVEGGAQINTSKGLFTDFLVTQPKVTWRADFENGEWTL